MRSATWSFPRFSPLEASEWDANLLTDVFRRRKVDRYRQTDSIRLSTVAHINERMIAYPQHQIVHSRKLGMP